jgi:hypothetical protein
MKQGFAKLLDQLRSDYPLLSLDELCTLIAGYAQNYTGMPDCVRQTLHEHNLRQVLSRGMDWSALSQRVAHALGLKVSNQWVPIECIASRLGLGGDPPEFYVIDEWWDERLLSLLAKGIVRVCPENGVMVDYKGVSERSRLSAS